MKKIIALVLALALALSLAGLVGCGGPAEPADGGETGEVTEPADSGEAGETGETPETPENPEAQDTPDSGELTEPVEDPQGPTVDVYDFLLATAKEKGTYANGVWSYYYPTGDSTTNGILCDEAGGTVVLYLNIDRWEEKGVNTKLYLTVGRGRSVCTGYIETDVTQSGERATVTAGYQIDPATFTANTAITTTDRELKYMDVTLSVPDEIVRNMEELLPGAQARSLKNLDSALLRPAGYSLADLGFTAM